MSSKLRKAQGTRTPVMKKPQGTYARLDQWGRAQVCAYRTAGKSREDICLLVNKKDGTRPTLRTADAVLEKKAGDPGWRGEDYCAGGRPRALSAAQRRKLTNLVFSWSRRAPLQSAVLSNYGASCAPHREFGV